MPLCRACLPSSANRWPRLLTCGCGVLQPKADGWKGGCGPERASIPLERSMNWVTRLGTSNFKFIGNGTRRWGSRRLVGILSPWELRADVIGAALLSDRSPFLVLHYVFAKRSTAQGDLVLDVVDLALGGGDSAFDQRPGAVEIEKAERRQAVLDATGGAAEPSERYAAVLRSEWRVALDL